MQQSATLEELIVSHPFLAGLDRRFIELLDPCASLRRFGSQQRIFSEGAEADHFYLINSGKVILQTAIPDQDSLPILTLMDGDPLGWSWLFPPYRWCFTALSLAPTEVISFGAGFLRERAEEDLAFGNELLMRMGKTMIERMQALRKKLIASVSSSQVCNDPKIATYVV